MYKAYWPKKYDYQRCASFYKESQKIQVTSGPFAGKSVWYGINQRLQEVSDMTDHRVQQNESRLWYHSELILKKLRNDPRGPEAIIDMVEMLLPPYGGRPGCCALFPEGLGSPVIEKVTEDGLAQLLEPLGSTVTFDEQKEGGRAQARESKAEVKAKGAGKARVKAASLTKGPKCVQVESLTSDKAEMSILGHIYETCEYLRSVDDRQDSKVEGLKYAAFKCRNMCEGYNAQTARPLAIAKAVKIEMFELAKIVLRPSDLDISTGIRDGIEVVVLDYLMRGDPSRGAESVRRALLETAEASVMIDAFLNANKASDPIQGHVWDS